MCSEQQVPVENVHLKTLCKFWRRWLEKRTQVGGPKHWPTGLQIDKLTGQLISIVWRQNRTAKHLLWQTVTQLKAIGYWGCELGGVMQVSIVWDHIGALVLNIIIFRTYHFWISLIIHFVICITASHVPIRHFPLRHCPVRQFPSLSSPALPTPVFVVVHHLPVLQIPVTHGTTKVTRPRTRLKPAILRYLYLSIGYSVVFFTIFRCACAEMAVFPLPVRNTPFYDKDGHTPIHSIHRTMHMSCICVAR